MSLGITVRTFHIYVTRFEFGLILNNGPATEWCPSCLKRRSSSSMFTWSLMNWPLYPSSLVYYFAKCGFMMGAATLTSLPGKTIQTIILLSVLKLSVCIPGLKKWERESEGLEKCCIYLWCEFTEVKPAIGMFVMKLLCCYLWILLCNLPQMYQSVLKLKNKKRWVILVLLCCYPWLTPKRWRLIRQPL